MQLKIKTLKNTSILLTFLLTGALTLNAQQEKIDGVAVVIGKNIVLNSDIDNFKKEVELKSEGKIKISDCEMLEELMQQKLLAHHAVIDSVVVSQAQIDERVQNSISYFTNEFGSQEKAIKAYGFSNIQEFTDELTRVQKENALIKGEQEKITQDLDVTPEEIRVYFKSLEAKNELPKIPAEAQVAQIVLKAEPSKEEINRVIKKLKDLKKQIEEGAGFELKAIINSDDPSVARNSGNMGIITKETGFVKEFKEVAFSLEEGQISEPFKSPFGYHIVLLNKIRGNGRDVSHILIQPEISEEKLNETKADIEKIKKDIEEGNITFEEAVKKYSEEDSTKNNGGMIINPYTQETSFELTRMPPDLYARISELKQGELSDVFYDETREGEKMYKIILLKTKTETHEADLVEDYVRMQQFALAKKQEETVTKWTKNKIKETYIKLNSDYKKCTFKRNWRKDN